VAKLLGTSGTLNIKDPFSYSDTRRFTMPKYVIEREMPGVGQLSAEELRVASQNSNGILAEMRPEIQWVESYVTDDKIYGIFIAQSEDVIRQHALQAGFPAHAVSAVVAVINPTTAEGQTSP
jgi:hypothetical protein